MKSHHEILFNAIRSDDVEHVHGILQSLPPSECPDKEEMIRIAQGSKCKRTCDYLTTLNMGDKGLRPIGDALSFMDPFVLMSNIFDDLTSTVQNSLPVADTEPTGPGSLPRHPGLPGGRAPKV